MNKKQKQTLYRIIISAVLLIGLHFIPVTGVLRILLYLIPFLIIGYDVLRKAFKGIKNRQPMDESLLMTVATLGAMILGIYEDLNGGKGDYVEAVAVMLFYQTGEWFQSVAVGKSRRNISELMDIRPDYANIEKDGKIERVDPDEVEIGTVICVQPGEKVPIDGEIAEGSGMLDTAALTGESVPRSVSVGDEVISGCINLNTPLKIKTTKEFGESTVSKILDLVENASSRKSRSEDFITKFARVYTPAVVCSALALAVLPPVFRLVFLGVSPMWGSFIYRALAFLVISCPCALVVSIPLSFFAGIGGASRAGVLIKGSNYMETLSKVDTVVFDKTGTLTEGTFEVDAVHHSPMNEKELIETAALAEAASNHPISQSLKRAYAGDIDRSRVSDIEEIAGQGILASVDGKRVAVGNVKLMKTVGAEYRECPDDIGTVIHVAIDGEYEGHILISDVVKPHSEQAVRELKGSGVKKTVMLTGDASKIADKVARELGIDEVHAELLPAGKVDKVEELLSSRDGKNKLAFVGDGINDAPVLSRADIGIAMGALGSDAAIEAADIVLMDDDPLKIPQAIRIARKCLGIVKQNIVFAIGVKLLCLLLSALGVAGMWMAVFADVGVMMICVLNAIRALMVKK
ncbi:MAG TPA: cadmium-translocating P-type ATPase [Lachnospiraceae bacterium]|nr:cadmium-translocating P-type ATPase [Lachnospiraceae bacterium]HBB60072.1 cadmium-translocating P-type ATPase [Lachnospiraceae bacterium]HCS00045.1 cadmium-translocating P-type ATPase [Lachnospiraceae bacterium]